MKKECELEIVTDNVPCSYLYTALPLSIILKQDVLKPWVLENFIETQWIKHAKWERTAFYYSGFTKNLESGFSNLLQTQQYNYAEIEKPITNFLKHQLEMNKYVCIFLDEYFLECKASYHSNHYVHESLIYGYKDETREFLMVGYNKLNAFTKMTCNYDELEKAYYEGAKTKQVFIGPNENCVTLIKLKPFVSPYPFSLKKFKHQICNYLNGQGDKAFIYFLNTELFGLEDMENITYGFGVELFDKLMFELDEKEVFCNEDYIKMFFLYEHTNGMYLRLKYILEMNLFKDEKFIQLVREYQELVKTAKLNYIKIIKYVRGNDNYQQKVIMLNKSLREWKQREQSILMRCLELFNLDISPETEYIYFNG